jgi:hypothetical protein
VAQKKLSGVKLQISKAVRGALVVGDAIAELLPNKWYEIKSTAAVSILPSGMVETNVFKTPDVGETPLVPAIGDDVYPLNLEIMCKTDGEISAEEGTIDVTTDCDGGYNVSILDGFVTISGTINGFLSFDDETEELNDSMKDIFNKFFDVTTDDGAGGYTVTLKENEKIMLFILLNKSAKLADIQNYLIVPVYFTTLGTGAGLKDAQKRDITFTKAGGLATRYERTVKAGDLIS